MPFNVIRVIICVQNCAITKVNEVASETSMMIGSASGSAEATTISASGTKTGIGADLVTGIGGFIGISHVAQMGSGLREEKIVAITGAVIFGDAVSLRNGNKLATAGGNEILIDGEVRINQHEDAEIFSAVARDRLGRVRIRIARVRLAWGGAVGLTGVGWVLGV